MKVILTQGIPNLGPAGKVVNVKDGYARNFLLPKGSALIVTPENLKIVEEKKKKEEIKSKKEKEEALALAERLTNASCTIAVKVIEQDRIFGSVTSDMIQRALEAEGIKVDKKVIHLEEPIKNLGVYQVPLKLHPEVVSSCKVWVVKE